LYVDIPEIKQPAAISDDGQYLAARTLNDAGTSVWNIITGTAVGELVDSENRPVISEVLAFDPESRRLAVLSEKNVGGQPRILIYELDSLRLTETIDIARTRLRPFVDCLCFQPGGNILAASVIENRTHQIRLWNVDDGTPLARLPVDRFFGGYAAIRRPQRIDFSRDGRTLVAGGQAGAIKGWDLSELATPESSSDPSQVKEVFHNSPYAGSVGIAQIGPNGRWLATRGVDRALRIWDLPTGRLATETPNVMATSLDWSSSGEFLLGRSSTSLQQWQFVAPLSESQHFGSWAQYDGRYTWLQFSPQGDSLALARGPSVYLIDPSAPQESTFLARQGLPLAFSPDGGQLWGCDQSSVWTRQLGGSGGEVYQNKAGQDEARVNGSRNYTSLSVRPSGELLICGTENRVRLRVFDLETGEELWRDEQDSRFTSLNRPGPVFSADGSQIAFRYDSEGVVKHWESATGRLVNQFRLPDSHHLLFQDNRLLAIEGKTVTDLQDDRQVGELLTDIRELTRLSISPDGQRIAWRAKNQILIARPNRQADQVTIDRVDKPNLPRRDFMAFNRRGSRLAASDGPYVKVWDVEDGEPISTHAANPVAIGFLDDDSDSEKLMLVGRDRNVLQWNVDSTDPRRLHQLEVSQDFFFSWTRYPIFSSDGERIVYLTVQEDPNLYVWETRSGRQISKFSIDFRAARSGRAYTVSPNGKLIATLEGFHVQKVWDFENSSEVADLGQVPRTLSYPNRYVRLSPDGSKVARAIRSPNADADTNEFQVEVLSVATGRVTLAHRATDFRAFAFAADGMRLAVAEKGRMIVFNLETGEQLTTIGGRQSVATDVAFDHSGDILCAVSADDRQVTLWDTNTSAKLATFQTQHENLMHVAISPNARRLAVVASNGNVQIWNLVEARKELRQVGLDWSH
jgi:WD40 repeat protein